jgi:membrane associated rhomboid family serine protease
MRWWSLTRWLIVVNVAVFVLQFFSGDWLTTAGEFSAELGIYHLQIWRWVSYDFLHASVLHLLFNMWALWIFGPPVERMLGRARYLVFYLLSGIGGVLGYLLLWRLNILDTTRATPMIGASACIMGVIVAAAHFAPGMVIQWVFPPIQLRLKTLAWLYVGLAVLTIAARGENSGGEAAHLGGAAAGFVLVKNLEWFSVLRIGPRRRRFWKPGDPASNFFRNDG